MAAEALQEAETEVGVVVEDGRKLGRCGLPERLTGRPTRRAISALRPES